MSTEGVPYREHDPPGAATGATVQLEGVRVLDLCDALLGQVGRRDHLFSWLRPTGAGRGEWLPVDAYYPGPRLVVVCRELGDEDEAAMRSLVPAAGLALLRIKPRQLAPDPGRAGAQLRELLDEALEGGIMAAVARTQPPVDEDPAAVRGVLAERLAALSESLRRSAVGMPEAGEPAASDEGEIAPPVRRPYAHARARAQRAEAVPPPGGSTELAVAAALILAVELYIGVSVVAVVHSQWLLGVGLALDAAARLLGAVAARRARLAVWAWVCVVGGSPAVVVFAVLGEEGPARVDPAPLAAMLGAAALAAIALAVLGGALGI